MTKYCVAWLTAALLFVPCAGFGFDEQASFIDLSRPMAELMKFPQACPIRLSLGLPELLLTEEATVQNAKARAVKCQGAYFSTLNLIWAPNARTLGEIDHRPVRHGRLVFRPFITLPKGRDKYVEVDFRIMRGEKILAEGRVAANADEGEVNWEETTVWIDQAMLGSEGLPVILRLEARFSDR